MDKVSFVETGSGEHINAMDAYRRRGVMAYITLQQVTNYQPLSVVSRLAAQLRLWQRRGRERNQLARLSERDLHDIGMSRGTVYAELRKPFWRA